MGRACENCGGPLPLYARADKRFCGASCRAVAAKRRRRAEARSAIAEPPFGLAPEQQQMLDQATSEVRLVAFVANAAKTQWRAAAWLLERRHPERWSERGRAAVPPAPPDPDDPFREVDELAERRRQHVRPDGY